MPSARSHRLTKLKKRIQAHAERSKARARQFLSAVVIAGSMSLATASIHSTSSYALDVPANQAHVDATDLLNNPLRSGVVDSSAIEQDRRAVHQELEYWVFSDDFCGWASVKEILDPDQSFANEYASGSNDESIAVAEEPLVVENSALSTLLDSLKLETLLRPQSQLSHWSPIDPRATAQQTFSIDESLLSLAEQEPIDVENSPMTLECHASHGSQNALDSSVASGDNSSVPSPEEYLAYDLSRADQIALRMYPISIPHFHYLGGRRTESRSAFDYDSAAILDPALDCLGGGSIWIEEVQPSQSIEITRRSDQPVSQDFIINRAYSQLLDVTAAIQQHAGRLQRECDFYRAQVGSAVIDAVQPDSSLRNAVAGEAIGQELAAMSQAAKVVANDQLQWIASSLNDQKDFIANDVPLVAPEQTAGEQLLSRAGIEANTEMMTAAGVADDAANRVCCPVEQSDVAARLPATYSLAAVGVATATLKTPHAPSDEFGDELKVSSNPVSQAEALATACDSAAETLESLARALRKAGDSFIRVARSGTDPGLTREPTAELR